MIRKNMIEEYRRLNFRDRRVFRNWLIMNAVVGGALVFLGLVAAAWVGSGADSNIAVAQKEKMTLHAESH